MPYVPGTPVNPNTPTNPILYHRPLQPHETSYFISCKTLYFFLYFNFWRGWLYRVKMLSWFFYVRLDAEGMATIKKEVEALQKIVQSLTLNKGLPTSMADPELENSEVAQFLAHNYCKSCRIEWFWEREEEEEGGRDRWWVVVGEL